MTTPFIPISGSSPGGGGSSGYRKNSFSGASPSSAGGSRRRGSSSSSFGGRARDVLREAKEVLNRIKWDVAETMGVDFATAQVYVSAIRPGGGILDEADLALSSWCRQWVREGRCDRKHCRCTHALTLAPLGSKPSLKSSGFMAPLQVLEGDELEAAMGTAASCGSGSGAGSQGGGSFPSSSYYSSSPSGVPPLYRAVFVVFDGRVVWDKERPEVWEGFLARVNGGGEGSSAAGGAGAGAVAPALLLLRREPSVDSLPSDRGIEVFHSGGGNRMLNNLPSDVSWELLTQYLEPADCARCLATCRGWAERAGDEALWLHFLRQRFGLLPPPRKTAAVPAASPSARRQATTDRLCSDLSTLALQDDEELLAEAAALQTPPPTGAGTPPPTLPHPETSSVLQTPFYHPRQEYARLSHVCRNAQALSDWSGAVGGGGGGGRQGLGQSGSNGGGGSIFSSSPSVVYSSSSPQINGSTDLEPQLQSPAYSLPPPPTHPPPPPRQHVVQRFHGHDRGAVISLHVDEAKDRLISADVAGCVRLWELHSGARLGMVDLRMHLTCLTADARTIYVGTVKGTLHTINRDDMADVQAHKLQQASSISSLCLLQDAPRASPRRSRAWSTPSSVHFGSSTKSEDTHLLRTPSPLFFQSGTSLSAKTRSGLPQPLSRTPSPEGKGGPGEDDVRARLVIGFGNGSFMLLYGTHRLMHVQAPSSSSSTSSSSFLPTAPAVLHHLYSLPISHPACVFLAPTGPKSFVAAACPDRLFLWSAEEGGEGEAHEEEEEDAHAGGGIGMPAAITTEIAVLPLTNAFSKGVRPRPVVGHEEEEEEEEEEDLALKQEEEEEEDDDGTGLGLTSRHSLDECCDVAILALLPSSAEEEEEEEEEEGKGMDGRRPTLVVTACNHDVSLRWWELNPGGGGGRKRRHSRATCTAITPAFALPSESKLVVGGMGTLSLAHAGGVLLSAHLDGSLVVWHVGQRRPVAHLMGLPVLESLRLTPHGMDVLTCFDRAIVYARKTALALPAASAAFGTPTPGGGSSVASEEDGGDMGSSNSGRRRDRDKQGGSSGGRPRRKNSFA